MDTGTSSLLRLLTLNSVWVYSVCDISFSHFKTNFFYVIFNIIYEVTSLRNELWHVYKYHLGIMFLMKCSKFDVDTIIVSSLCVRLNFELFRHVVYILISFIVLFSHLRIIFNLLLIFRLICLFYHSTVLIRFRGIFLNEIICYFFADACSTWKIDEYSYKILHTFICSCLWHTLIY